MVLDLATADRAIHRKRKDMIASDQTDTERVLHRVLHVVQFLRVMSVYSIAAALALTVALLGGPHALPIVGVAFDSLSLQRAELEDETTFAAVMTLALVLVLAGSVWSNLATVLVWRRSLKMFAVVLALCGLLLLPGGAFRIAAQWAQLHPLFMALAAVHTLLMTWIALDWTRALWKLSSAPPRPGYVEALGLRLSRRPWDRLNRFLDLPRTPWRSRRSTAAYLLAAASLLLFSVSLGYLFLGGGVDTKLADLAERCADADPAKLRRCQDMSRAWAIQTAVVLIASVVGLKVALALRATARKLSALQAAQALQGDSQRFVLYLRPFPVDALQLPKPRLPLLSAFFSFRALPVLLEEELFDVCDGYAPLIAVGTPGNTELRGAVAYREYMQHGDWQAHVGQRVRDAHAIVMVLSTTPGVLWELHHVLQHGAWRKTLFLLDPAARDPVVWSALMAQVLAALHAAGLLRPQDRFEGQPLGFYFVEGGVVQVRNDHWSTTSYRIAFAQFLATRAPMH